jgi:hypothetical protein
MDAMAYFAKLDRLPQSFALGKTECNVQKLAGKLAMGKLFLGAGFTAGESKGASSKFGTFYASSC